MPPTDTIEVSGSTHPECSTHSSRSTVADGPQPDLRVSIGPAAAVSSQAVGGCLSESISRQADECLARRSAELLLGSDSNGFQKFIDALPSAIYSTDGVGRITHFNAACIEFSGRTPVIGSDQWCVTWKLYYPDGTPMRHDECPMAMALKQGRPVRGREAIAERPDGTRIWFEPYPSPLCDEQGKIVGGVNMLVDITERKRAEEVYRESELRQRRLAQFNDAVIASLGDGLYALDTEGRVTYVNPAAERLFGWSSTELLGRRMHEVIHYRHADGTPFPREDCAGLQVLRDGVMLRDHEDAFIRKDGSFFPVVYSSSPMITDGKVVGLVVVFRDVSDRKAAEQALDDAQQRLAAELETSRTLHEVSTRFIQNGDEQALYAGILDAAVKIMGSDSASMQIVDEERNALRLLAFRGFDPDFGRHFELCGPDSRTACSVARRTGQRVIVRDVEACEFIVGTPALEGLRKVGIRAVQSTPLFSRCGKMLGVISTQWLAPHEPSERDLHLLDVLARQAADLIDHRRGEEARSWLVEIVQSSDDAIISKDLDGRIRSWNKGAERLFGYTAEEAVGQPVEILFPADRLEEESKIQDRICKGERVQHFETVRRHKKGSLVDVSLSVSPITDAQGRIVGTAKILRNISDRKRAAEALRKSQEQYQRLVALLPAAVYTCEAPSGIITFYNQQAAVLWGREPEPDSTEERFCGSFRLWRADGSLMRHDETPMAMAVTQGRAFRNEEVVIERPDGTRIAVLVNIDPVREPDGRVIGAINTFHDVTAFKKAEASLRDSEERYRSLVSVITDVPWTTDAQGAFVSDQPAWRDYTGQSREALAGFGWVNALEPSCREQVLAAWKLACESGSLYQACGRFWHAASRQYRHFEVRATPLKNPDGTVRQWVGACTDVDEQRRSQEALRDLNRRKDEFLAMLSHELRNPLAPIISATRVLQLHERGGSENLMQQKAREIIERQVGHLTRLVNDLLEVSRVITGRVRLRLEEVDIREVIENALETVRPLLERRKLRLSVAPGGCASSVRADSIRLQQVFVNILNNAAKYTDEGGLVEITCENRGDNVLVCIRDDGIGIAPELLPRIFDLFAQGEQTLERSQGGLGIGLSLVQHLVALHGGTVEAHSSGIGMGSEFRIQLPVGASPSLSAAVPVVENHGPEAAHERFRILVVDDNRDACMMLSALLRHSGHSVQEANDGMQALQAALTWRPDIVLLDIGLPIMNGYQVAQRLRQESFAGSIRIVALTGYGQDEDVAAAHEAGFDAHLTKPINFDDLAKVIARWASPPSPGS